MPRFQDILVMVGWLLAAAFLTYCAAASLRAGDDARFAILAPMAVWATYRWTRVGEE